MGKRLDRIFKYQLNGRIQSLEGKEIDVVLNTRATTHGYMKSADEEIIIISDKRGDLHKILIDNIEEIIVDREVSY